MTFRTSRIFCCLPAMEQHSLLFYSISNTMSTRDLYVFFVVLKLPLCVQDQKHFNGWSVWLFQLSVCPSRIWGWLRIRWAEDASTYYYSPLDRQTGISIKEKSPAKCCFGFWFLWSTKYVCWTFIVVHCLPRSMIPLFYVVFHITNHNLTITVIESSSPITTTTNQAFNFNYPNKSFHTCSTLSPVLYLSSTQTQTHEWTTETSPSSK